MITKEEFQLMKENYLNILNDEYQDEYYMTPHTMADAVLTELCEFLFKEEDGKEIRRLQYLELQKEFG